MKKTVVQKYGGSSLADAQKIAQVAALVKQKYDAGYRVCVVVSAMGKTTDGLIAQAKQICENPSRRELDMLLTCGERASAALMAMKLEDLGVPAVSLTGSQAGIVTNDTHSGARILEVRPYRVEDELDRGSVVILAGFQGVSYRREITTLGRGGSDTTAVAMAAALDADCEIYSDVDGVFSADPRAVPNAVKLDDLTHEEMQELAAAGAKVLNAQAVQFAKARNIAIYARQTGNPSLGTAVRRDAPRPVGGVRGVAHRTLLHSLLAPSWQTAETLLSFLDDEKMPSGQIFGQETEHGAGGVFCLIPPEDAHGFTSFCERLPAGVLRGQDRGAVSLVGQGILEDRHIVLGAMRILREANIKIHGVSTSSFRVTFLLDAGDGVGMAARLLHDHFIPRDHSVEETA